MSLNWEEAELKASRVWKVSVMFLQQTHVCVKSDELAIWLV